MRRLPVIAHLPDEGMGRRYRDCPGPRVQTRRPLVWLPSRPAGSSSCERAAPLVGLSGVHGRNGRRHAR